MLFLNKANKAHVEKVRPENCKSNQSQIQKAEKWAQKFDPKCQAKKLDNAYAINVRRASIELLVCR